MKIDCFTSQYIGKQLPWLVGEEIFRAIRRKTRMNYLVNKRCLCRWCRSQLCHECFLLQKFCQAGNGTFLEMGHTDY